MPESLNPNPQTTAAVAAQPNFVAQPAPVPDVPVAAANVTTVVYESNPFITAINGLVNILRVNPAPAVLVTIIISAISIVWVILGIILFSVTGSNLLLWIMLLIVYIVITPVSLGSSLAVAAASLREEKVSSSDAIKLAFKKVFPFMGFMIVSYIMILLGTLLFIIPGIILLARTALGPVILFEENVGPIEAISRSMKLTKGHVFEMLGALFAGSMLSGNGLLAPVAGISPIVGRYQQLKSLEQSGSTSKPAVHWLNYAVALFPVVFFGLILILSLIIFPATKNLQDNTRNSTDIPPYSTPTRPTQDYNYNYGTPELN